MQERFYVNSPPLGVTRLTEWLSRHGDSLGRRYASELIRRTDRLSAYAAG